MAPQLSIKQWVLSHTLTIVILLLVLIQFFNVIDSPLRLSVLDVGQGDAILIQTPEYKNILIDAGEGGQVIEELGGRIGFFNSTIDLAIITHPHRDHFGGFLEMIQKYPVKRVMITGAVSRDPQYLALLEEIRQREIPIVFPKNDQDLHIGQAAYLDILYPFAGQSLLGMDVSNLNNTSIVSRLVQSDGTSTVLLPGDAERGLEREILLSGAELNAPILKLGHHGSRTATSDVFLAAVDPKTVVVSAGKDNKFGHPHAETMEKVKDLDVRNTIIDRTITFQFE